MSKRRTMDDLLAEANAARVAAMEHPKDGKLLDAVADARMFELMLEGERLIAESERESGT